MNQVFECQLVPRVVGPIAKIVVRVDDPAIDNYPKCMDLLQEKFPEYEIVIILEGYKRDGRSSSETS